MKSLQIFMALLLLYSCAHKNSKAETSKYSTQLKQDLFTYKGNYIWAFDLMGSEQISKHTFYADSIVYKMIGKVYSTDYTMKKLSYEKDKNKWIGEDKNGIIYVLFFKEKTNNTITIYKHKCKTDGLKEALEFATPTPDATSDHGWNIYSLHKNHKEMLPVSGSFVNGDNVIFISDSVCNFNKKNVQKISFHLGERRWVGKYKNEYLQVFFKNLKVNDSLQLSAKWFSNIEKLYKTKYHSVNDWRIYVKPKNPKAL